MNFMNIALIFGPMSKKFSNFEQAKKWALAVLENYHAVIFEKEEPDQPMEITILIEKGRVILKGDSITIWNWDDKLVRLAATTDIDNVTVTTGEIFFSR